MRDGPIPPTSAHPANSDQLRNATTVPAAEPRWPDLLALVVLAESIAAALLEAKFDLAGEIPWTDYYVMWLVPGVCICYVLFCGWIFQLYRSGEAQPIRAITAKLLSLNARYYFQTIIPIVVIPAFLASHTTLQGVVGSLDRF